MGRVYYVGIVNGPGPQKQKTLETAFMPLGFSMKF